MDGEFMRLADDLMSSMFHIRSSKSPRHLTEGMQGESFVLHFLDLNAGPAHPRDMSELSGVSSARIAAVLNSLEKKGLITRSIDPEDRRQILVELTEAGRDQIRAQRQSHLENVAHVLEFLGEVDAKEFVRLTKRLGEYARTNRDSMQGCPPVPPPPILL